MRVACLRAPERNIGGHFAERTKSLKFLLKVASLRRADVFPIVFRRERSGDRKYVCASQAMLKSVFFHFRYNI